MSDEVVGWLQKVEADPDFNLIASAVATLDQFGTNIRYPGASATPQDACLAFVALKQLRAFVQAKLGLT
jgi:hypothetical protein